jgi:glycosyltransferase involved in cell wall biosynthesis
MSKITYLITRSDTVGGAHVHLLYLACKAQTEGHTVEVLVGGNGLYAALLRENGLRVLNLRYLVRPIRPHLDAFAVLECWLALKRFKPDIVHVHSTKAGLVGRVAAKLAGIPVVFTAHGWAFTEGIAEQSRRLAVFLEKRAARLSDAIICVSEYDRQLALRLGVCDKSLITRIHNGVPDVHPDQRSICSRIGPVRVVCVARLDAPKKHLLLLEAMATIDKLPWVLELIGDGPLTAEVRQRAHDLGVADRVEFSGLCNDVPSRLAVADVFVLASAWEGLPLSILEAMRAGLPVVASDVGGVAESVNDGVTGFLVPKGDKAVLADRLMRLLGDVALRQQMGRAGRTMYEREFAFAVMYQRTQKIYNDVLERKVTRQ